MKTQRRRGFTVVELVVVIAIIAVLAAVLIPTFTSIIKKANDSAALQERTNQRLEDIAQKVDNANWLSWEDFEAKLATELAKINKDKVTPDDVKAAVNAALKTYADEHGTSGSGITKEQVETIVKQAISEQGSLTTAQVEAVVKEAIANGAVSGVSEATVRQIVNSAVAGISKQTGVTKAEMTTAITNALKGVSGLTEAQVKDIVEKALSGFNTISESEVKKIVDDAIAGLDGWVYIAGDYEITDGKTYVLRTDAPLGTVNITATVTTVKRLIIDAPNVQKVNINCDVETLEIQRTASTSTHIFGDVDEMIINKGRAVVEAGAKVDNLTAAPYANANVIVVIAAASNTKSAGSVGTLNAEYQDNGTGTNDTIEIINAGSVGTSNLTASEALEASGTTTTNVQVTNVNQASNSATSADKITEGASPYIPASETVEVSTATSVEAAEQGTTTSAVSTEVNGNFEARIGSQPYPTFREAAEAAGVNDVVVLLKDIDLVTRYEFTKSITINGAGHTVRASSETAGYQGKPSEGRVLDIDGDYCASGAVIKLFNLNIQGEKTAVRGISLYGTENVTLIFDNCSVWANYYAINVASANTGLKVTVRNGTFSTGWCAIQSWSPSAVFTIENSVLKGINNKSYNADGWNNFSTIVVNGDATNNVWTLTNCTIEATQTTGNKQTVFSFRSTGTQMNLTNCDIVVGTGCSLIDESGSSNALTVTSSTLNGETFNYSYTTPVPTAHYYWDGGDGGNVQFNTPFEQNWLCDGEYIDLIANVTLSENVTVPFNSGSFTLNFKGYTISGSGKVVLPTGVSVISDTAGMSSVFSGTVAETDNGNGTYTYTAQ